MTIKEQLRYYGKLVRSGNATDADKAFLARAQRAFDYLGYALSLERKDQRARAA